MELYLTNFAMLQNGSLSKAHFYKTNNFTFSSKRDTRPYLVQFSGVFSCTLSSRTQKKLFEYDCDISVANLPEKRVETIDRSRYTL
jgi:hypothetical protein